QGKNDELEDGLAQPLLVDANERQDEDGDDCDDSEEASEESRRPATSIASAYRLLTPSVKVQLLIYFMLKYAMEILLSESSVITSFYFSWSTSTGAIFLAILGLTAGKKYNQGGDRYTRLARSSSRRAQNPTPRLCHLGGKWGVRNRNHGFLSGYDRATKASRNHRKPKEIDK
ncbi:SPX domain-containing membrane protein Os02g45520, partial [Ananas comosus]